MRVKCPKCDREVPAGNFCALCATKLKEVCDCWIKKEPYNCEQEKCPGYRLYVLEAGKESKVEKR